MREIKFRAYLKKEHLLEQGYNLLYFEKIGYMVDVVKMDFDDDSFSFICPSLIEYYPFDKANIMQYIGLKDKNDKEIYEGDVLKTPQLVRRTGIPEYELFLIEAKMMKSCGCCSTIYGWELPRQKCNECKIIGNIYENPKLIKNGN